MGSEIALVPAMTGSPEAYVGWISQIPILSEVEEAELFRRLREEHDLEAAKQLVLHHLRFVVHIARGYLGYGLPQADLIQEGTIGLMKAVKKFDLNYGVRLVTFAVYWIKAEIHEYILRNWRIVKIATTKAQRRLFFNLRKTTKQLNWFSGAEIDHIASELQVSPSDVRQMEARMCGSDLSLDLEDEKDGEHVAMINSLVADERTEPLNVLMESEDSKYDLERLRQGLAELDERSRDIVQQRWLVDKKSTLQDLAEQYHISSERVRQIEAAAFKKLAKHLTCDIG